MQLHELCQSKSQVEECIKCRSYGYRHIPAPCGLEMKEITDLKQHITEPIILEALRKLSVKNTVEETLDNLT